MQIVDIKLERFKSFSFVSINIEYKKNASFILIFLHTCIDNNIRIIIDLDNVFINETILFQDNIEIN